MAATVPHHESDLLPGNLEAAFEQTQRCVGSQRQQRRGDCAGENEAIID